MFVYFFNKFRVIFQLNLSKLRKTLGQITKKYYIYQKKVLQNFYIWNPQISKCLFCKEARQKKVNGINIANPNKSFCKIGFELGLYIVQEMNILMDKNQVCCYECLKNFIENLYSVNWKKENIFICEKSKDTSIKLANTYLNSKKIWKLFENVQKKDGNILNNLLKAVTSNEFFSDKKSKAVTGLTVKQLKVLCNEMIDLIKQYEIGSEKLSYFELDNKLYTFNTGTKQGKNRIITGIIILLMKWKLNVSNNTLHSIVNRGINFVNSIILEITSVMHIFSEKYLINTREKLEKNTNVYYNKLMGISPEILVVLADGVRFNCYKCRSDYHMAYLLFDNKHLMTSFNTIGFVTTTGKYIGFIPECGVGSDGHHGDGYVMDFILLNNVGDLLDIILVNSRPFANDGTRIIFDRALKNGCHTYKYGLFNYATPTLKTGLQSTYQADASRWKATSYRWMVERCFGNIGVIWCIFRAATSRIISFYVPYFGKWLNFAAAICNKFSIGMPVFDKERLEQTDWMINRKANCNYTKLETLYLKKVIDKFRYMKSLNNFWDSSK